MIPERLELPEPSQAVLRAARALLRRKERKSVGKFLVEGPQAVREALEQPEIVEAVFFRWGSVHDHLELLTVARAAGVAHYAVSEQNLATLSDTVTPQGVVAVCRTLDVPLAEAVTPEVALVVICAQIRDPGNAGTVIRCADAFGADAVILSSDSVEVYNPKTVRASVGSIFHLPLVVGVDLAEAIDACRAAGLQVFATDGEAGTELTDLTDALAAPTAWVMGNESWGLPVEHLELADTTVAVPIYGRAESLNLATAAAVCLYASASAQHTRAAIG
ncbi:MAG TPA: RNA methyltransferase [Micropruina sp.]|nr:RNA methyltransferase [Micropruina sp.]